MYEILANMNQKQMENIGKNIVESRSYGHDDHHDDHHDHHASELKEKDILSFCQMKNLNFSCSNGNFSLLNPVE